MKDWRLSKWLGASVMAASLAVLPFTISAQAQTTTTQPDGQVGAVQTNNDDGFDWGWLGLLGLIGLAGLAGKNRRETTDYVVNDPNATVRPGSDYRP